MIPIETIDNVIYYETNNPDNVRLIRNKLLADTDWAGASDVTMSDAMRTYRQALRDIPQQPDFPNRFTIPVKPE